MASSARSRWIDCRQEGKGRRIAMRKTKTMRKTIKFAGLAVVLLWTILSAAQLTPDPAKGYKPPRTADGHADLNGTYDVATITPLVRLPIPGVQRALTDDQAAKA